MLASTGESLFAPMGLFKWPDSPPQVLDLLVAVMATYAFPCKGPSAFIDQFKNPNNVWKWVGGLYPCLNCN